jgi:long-chain acyl-CoA synthetase
MIPIASLLPRAAALFPSRCAVRDGETQYTYLELLQRVEALASVFGKGGLQKGDRVAILDNNSFQYAEAYYACAHARLILVPLNSRLAAPELVYQLNDSTARLLLVGASHLDIMEAMRPKLDSVEWVMSFGRASGPAGALSYERLISEQAGAAVPATQSSPDDVAQIYYTSGTTGDPKGVCLTHGNMITSAIDSVIGLELNERDIWLHAAPMFHLVDAWAMWAMPLLGASQVMLQFTPERALQTIDRTRPTAAGMPPALINMMAGHPGASRYDLSSLRVICYGGAPTPLGVLQRAAKVLSSRLAHGYGITETSGIATLASSEDFHLSGSPEQLALTDSAGRALPHIRLAVVDVKGSPCPVGQPGEVVISGARVMRGYWNKPDHTESALRNGWYHTGDLGYLDDQQRLYIVDRIKDMIITGGENVYSVEVERAIAEHPDVREVAVIGVPSETWGEAVMAVVVLRDGAQVSEQELIDHCGGRIANYKKPKSIVFHQGELPKTGPGKLAKARLRAPYWEGRDRRI